jgi:hypothetical protein
VSARPMRDVTQRRAPTELRPTKRQLGTIRSLEKRVGRRRRRIANRAEATLYFRELRGELNAREARAERERNPDQLGLPAAETCALPPARAPPWGPR